MNIKFIAGSKIRTTFSIVPYPQVICTVNAQPFHTIYRWKAPISRRVVGDGGAGVHGEGGEGVNTGTWRARSILLLSFWSKSKQRDGQPPFLLRLSNFVAAPLSFSLFG